MLDFCNLKKKNPFHFGLFLFFFIKNNVKKYSNEQYIYFYYCVDILTDLICQVKP